MSQPVVVVTGASRGIGRHLADGFETAGYVVERGSRTVADVTDRAEVESWVADIVTQHGRIDVVVNNAGVIDREVSLSESDPDQWWATVEGNVRGPYLMTWAVLPVMLSVRQGRFINLNSGAGIRPGAVATAYNLSKSALGRLTGSTHLEGWAQGVRAFDLAPGVVQTDMTRSMVAHRGRTEWTTPAEVTALALALAGGTLDAWSGRFVRAGVDTVESLRVRAEEGLADRDRTVALAPYGEDDPLS